MGNIKQLIEQFHKYYYNSKVWTNGNTTWLGYPILKNPLDLFLYQEILYSVQPDIIIECGTYKGGSALFLCSILDSIGKGQVLSIDISLKDNLPIHERLTYFQASSTSDEAIKKVKSMVKPTDSVMVILDSDHSKHHVLTELKHYHSFVTTNSYLIVEDTNINGHPVFETFGPGPMEAVDEFLKENTNFTIDESKHKFLISFNPRGYLKRRK